jgi:hypothetical protein
VTLACRLSLLRYFVEALMPSIRAANLNGLSKIYVALPLPAPNSFTLVIYRELATTFFGKDHRLR